MKQSIKLKFSNGFFAGLIAICLNTLLLRFSALFSVKAEGGGLLKLLLQTGRNFSGHYPFLRTEAFALFFHYFTGFVMVYLYVYVFEPLTTLRGWLKGSLFSLLPWLINSLVILPLLGCGIVGFKVLHASGIVYFFVANWLFGLLLGVLFNNMKTDIQQ